MSNRGVLHEALITNKLVNRGFEIVSEASGFSNTFPDIIAYKNEVALHIEVKHSKKAQMGSCRRWEFSERDNFYVQGYLKEHEKQVLRLLNESFVAREEALKYLSELKRIVSPDIDILNRNAVFYKPMQIEEKRALLKEFQQRKTGNNQIATITSRRLNAAINNYYIDKFEPWGSVKNALLIIFGDEVFYIPNHKNTATRTEVAQSLGMTEIPLLPDTIAIQLECRIQPRIKGACLDLMASYRYSSKVAAGVLT